MTHGIFGQIPNKNNGDSCIFGRRLKKPADFKYDHQINGLAVLMGLVSLSSQECYE
jgi:hypothetical protein